jgi:hypothetical protein
MVENQQSSSDKEMNSDFQRNYRLWRIVATLRWFTLVVGPIAIFVDDFLQPWIEQSGLPNFVTMEDLTRWFLLDILPLDLWIDFELFLRLYHMLNKVACVLLLVLIPWAMVLKRKTQGTARDLARHEARMTLEAEESV